MKKDADEELHKSIDEAKPQPNKTTIIVGQKFILGGIPEYQKPNPVQPEVAEEPIEEGQGEATETVD